MEVEFLGNMRYTLYISDVEWKNWDVKLGEFWKIFEKGSKSPIEAPPRVLNPPLLSPGGLPISPSPPASTHTSAPHLSSHSFNSSIPSHPHPLSLPPNLLGEPALESHDQVLANAEPPAKRQALSTSSSVNAKAITLNEYAPNTFTSSSSGPTSVLIGPRPNLSISTAKLGIGVSRPSAYSTTPPGGSSKTITLPSFARMPQSRFLPSLPQNMEHAPRISTPFFYHRSVVTLISVCGERWNSFANECQSSLLIHTFSLSCKSLLSPPSASMPQSMSYSQMHYQPLGKLEYAKPARLITHRHAPVLGATITHLSSRLRGMR